MKRAAVQLRGGRSHWADLTNDRTICGRALVELPVERQFSADDDWGLPGDPCRRCADLVQIGITEGLEQAPVVLPPSAGLLFKAGPFHNSPLSSSGLRSRGGTHLRGDWE